MTSLRALECLVAVADCGSITHAAAQLHSSQPALSHQLAALEREAGTPLLLRQARGVRLTPAGRVAVADARRAIESAASAMRSARATGKAGGGSLRVAIAQSLITVLAPVLGKWHREHREVVITVRESTSAEELQTLLDSDQVDLVLAPGPLPERFTLATVADEEIVLAAPADHPLAAQQAVALQDLDGVCLVQFAPSNGLSGWLDHALAQAGVRIQPVIQTAVTSAAPQLAAAGLGVAICPVSALAPGFAGAARPFAPPWTRTLVAATAGEPDPLTARFIAELAANGVPVPDDVRSQLRGAKRTQKRRAAIE